MGNQMFEYAFARALSLRNGMELYLDACALDPKRHTRFSLGAFNVGAPFVDAERKSLVITPRFEIKRRLYKALKIPYRLSPTHLREKSFAFDPSVLSVENSRYVEGLWQSENIFRISRTQSALTSRSGTPKSFRAIRCSGRLKSPIPWRCTCGAETTFQSRSTGGFSTSAARGITRARSGTFRSASRTPGFSSPPTIPGGFGKILAEKRRVDRAIGAF